MTTITEMRTAQEATGTLTATANVDINDTITIGGRVYTFVHPLATGTDTVLISDIDGDHTYDNAGDASATLDNLVAAVNAATGGGSTYWAPDGENEYAVATAGAGDTVVFSTRIPGSVAITVDSDHLTFACTTTVNGSAVTCQVGDIVCVGVVSDETPAMPAQQTTVGQYTTDNSVWSRAVRASDQAVTLVRSGAYSVAMWLAAFVQVAVKLEESLTWTPPVINTQPEDATVSGGYGGGRYADFTIVVGSELMTLTDTSRYVWQESDDGTFLAPGGHLTTPITTGGIYDVSVAGRLRITPTDATKNHYYYRCVVTDEAATPGSVTSDSAQFHVAAP